MNLGVDISNNNGHVDWPALAKDGIKYAWVKATEGATFTDPFLATNLKQARAAGVAVGAYHFAVPSGRDAAAEAKFFASTVALNGGVKPGDLRPALDLEKTNGPKGRELSQWALSWLVEVERLLGVRPVFYSYPSFIDSTMGGAAGLIGYDLWLASYGPNDGKKHTPRPVGHWSQIAVHQFTSNGKCGGMSRADLNDALVPLEKLQHKPTPTPTPTPPKPKFGPPWSAVDTQMNVVAEGRLISPLFWNKIRKVLVTGEFVTIMSQFKGD